MKFSRRTWYFLLVLAAAFTMTAGLGALVYVDLTAFNLAGFGAMGLSVLFLAAERDNEIAIRKRYFVAFLLVMSGYMFGGIVGILGLAMAWPMLIYTETKRGEALSTQLRVLIVAESLHALCLCAVVVLGFTEFVFYANLLGVLVAVARGWAALVLSRGHFKQPD